jgi:hypothetical protein
MHQDQVLSELFATGERQSDAAFDSNEEPAQVKKKKKRRNNRQNAVGSEKNQVSGKEPETPS